MKAIRPARGGVLSTGLLGALVSGALASLLTACQLDGAPSAVDGPVDAAAGEVPMELAGANEAALMVPVFINGEGPFRLVLDTGATFTCVTTELAARLDLPEQRGAIGYGAGVHSAGRVRLVRYDSVRVGNAVARDMGGCVLDLSSLDALGAAVDGLLGLNFLRAFDVQLDFQRRVVILTAPAS